MPADHPEHAPTRAPGVDRLAEPADDLLAWGGQHRVTLRRLYEDERDVYPLIADTAAGYEVVDAEGRRFIDWTASWGPVLLGYRHPDVEAAIKAQLEAGPLLPLMHSVEVEVAAMLVEMIPCAEMVAFGKNGSDVTTAAVRIARAATGRQLVLQWGFHGFHDWYTCRYRTKNAKGIPTVLRAFIESFEYNDLGSLERLFDRYPEEVAAVIMEPVNNLLPDQGFLEGVKEVAHANGALLIFDEVVTGFRVAKGGAQEYFGVVPDLACFGKALANGMPLAAVVGRREYMQLLPSTAWGMTFRGETLSLAAARAVLEVLEREPVVEHLTATGERLRDGFRNACSERGIGADLCGLPSRMAFDFFASGCFSRDGLLTFFLRECAANGVLTNGVMFPSYAHDAEAVERTLEALDHALDSVAEALKSSRAVVHEAIRAGFGGVGPAAAGVPGGAFESIDVTPTALELEGWILGEHGALDSVEVVDPQGEVYVAERRQRPDLVEAFPDAPRAAAGGYRARLPASPFSANGGHEFTLIARDGDKQVFNCRVIRAQGTSSSLLPMPRWTGESLQI